MRFQHILGRLKHLTTRNPHWIVQMYLGSRDAKETDPFMVVVFWDGEGNNGYCIERRVGPLEVRVWTEDIESLAKSIHRRTGHVFCALGRVVRGEDVQTETMLGQWDTASIQFGRSFAYTGVLLAFGAAIAAVGWYALVRSREAPGIVYRRLTVPAPTSFISRHTAT